MHLSEGRSGESEAKKYMIQRSKAISWGTQETCLQLKHEKKHRTLIVMKLQTTAPQIDAKKDKIGA